MTTTFSALDICTGSVLLFAFCVGLPLNLVSVYYFFRHAKSNTTTIIYRAITITDSAICFNGYPVFITLFSGRKPMLFGNFWFCQFWGISYEPFPYYSVFLVLAMSTLRTILLYKPFWRISKPLVAKVIIPYFFILIFRFTMAAIFVGHYKYETFSGYAWNHMTIIEYITFDLVLSNALMAFPIIPIILMCIFNVKKIWETGAKKKFSISKPGADVNMPKKSFSQSISQAFSSTSGKTSTFGDTVVTSGKLSTQSKRTIGNCYYLHRHLYLLQYSRFH